MANRKVVLVWLCRTPDGWRRYPVAAGKNGRPRPGWVLVEGREKNFPEGRYQLRYYEGSRMVYEDAGESAGEAMVSRQRKANLLIAKESADLAGVKIEGEVERIHLQRARSRFLRITEDRGSTVAAAVYATASAEFLEVTGRTYADEITADDILYFHRTLRGRGCSDRTVYNRHTQLMAFLRFCKLNVKELAPSTPKYERTIPETYAPEDLKRFFSSIRDEKQFITFSILLQCGLREQEAVYLEWSNTDLRRGVLRVRANPKYGFKVKDCEERELPIPDSLRERMKCYRSDHPKQLLVTGTRTDQPNTKLLRSLKRAVHHAELNCGRCDACKERNECERWFLHKFRATYITTLLRSGMDLRTVMKLSGHSDLESVMRYLSPAGDAAVRKHVSKIKWM